MKSIFSIWVTSSEGSSFHLDHLRVVVSHLGNFHGYWLSCWMNPISLVWNMHMYMQMHKWMHQIWPQTVAKTEVTIYVPTKQHRRMPNSRPWRMRNAVQSMQPYSFELYVTKQYGYTQFWTLVLKIYINGIECHVLTISATTTGFQNCFVTNKKIN